MLERDTLGWAIECTDECSLSRTGHYACAVAGFVVALLSVAVGVTTVLLLLGAPELVASFTIVFGFFVLWAGTWTATAAVWNARIARRTVADSRRRRAIE